MNWYTQIGDMSAGEILISLIIWLVVWIFLLYVLFKPLLKKR